MKTKKIRALAQNSNKYKCVNLSQAQYYVNVVKIGLVLQSSLSNKTYDYRSNEGLLTKFCL
jgi:hypothetical protein